MGSHSAKSAEILLHPVVARDPFLVMRLQFILGRDARITADRRKVVMVERPKLAPPGHAT